jgi:hypothetical protein
MPKHNIKNTLKRCLAASIAFLLMGAFAQAYEVSPDLNATVAQLTARYGKPKKVERAWYGAGMSYGFQPNPNLYVYATTNPSGSRVEDLIYIRFKDWINVPYTSQEARALMQQNLDHHITWRSDYPGVSFWDGIEDVKHLGKEHGVMQAWSLNYNHAVIGNTRKLDTKDINGNPIIAAQVRTLDQFQAEQSAIR